MTALPSPQKLTELIGMIPVMEHPEFKTITQSLKDPFYALNYYSAYASLIQSIVRNKPDLFTAEEKEKIDGITHRLVGLQAMSLALKKGAFETEDHEQVAQNLALLIRDFAKNNGKILMPAGSRTHVVLLEIQKRENDQGGGFLFTFYNAGYGVNLTNETDTIYTHEARPKEQLKVWGVETYECKDDPAVSADTKALCVISYALLGLLSEGMPIDNYQADGLLDGPIEQKPTHVQSVPNCSTRTIREFLRFNLPEATYKKLYKIISGQGPAADLKQLIEAAPELNIERTLFEYIGNVTCTPSGDKYAITFPTHLASYIGERCPERRVEGRENTFTFDTVELSNLLEQLQMKTPFPEAFTALINGKYALAFRPMGKQAYKNPHSDLPHPY